MLSFFEILLYFAMTMKFIEILRLNNVLLSNHRILHQSKLIHFPDLFANVQTQRKTRPQEVRGGLSFLQISSHMFRSNFGVSAEKEAMKQETKSSVVRFTQHLVDM